MQDPAKMGTGLLDSPPSPKDWHLGFLASAPKPIVWSKEFRLAEPKDSNQKYADCCVAEATSYFNEQLRSKYFSVRSVFAYIAQGYGAYLRDGPKRVYDAGQETLQENPDPEPKTYQNMRDKTGLNPQNAIDDKAIAFFDTQANPDQLAQAIRDFRGAIFGVHYYAPTWTDLTHPEPPPPNTPGEGHALYAFGYHMHDGQKCIIAKSSWCGAQPGHHEHHFKENYFNSGYVFTQAFVLLQRSNMVRRYIVQKGAKLGVLVSVDGDGIFTDTVFWAKSEEHLAQLKHQYEVPENAERIVYPV